VNVDNETTRVSACCVDSSETYFEAALAERCEMIRDSADDHLVNIPCTTLAFDDEVGVFA
jgi:hypothetical protein